MPGRPAFDWTPEAREQAAKLWAEGRSVRVIGYIIGCGRTAFEHYRNRHLPPRNPGRPAFKPLLPPGPERDRAVWQMVQARATQNRIAITLGISHNTVMQIVERLRQSEGPREPKPMVQRRCLHCGQMRMSTGPGDRLHDRCRAAVADTAFTTEHAIAS